MPRRVFIDIDPEEHLEFKKLALNAGKTMKSFLTEIVKKTVSESKKLNEKSKIKK